jgi:unsaturated rhamnogalacturonyl hydrolase
MTDSHTEAAVTSLATSLIEMDYETWNFGDSVGFEGLLRASDATGDPTYASFAHGWIRAWATRAQPYRRLDTTAPGTAIVSVARRTGDDRVITAACDLAAYLMSRPLIRGMFATWEHAPLMRPYGGELMSARDARWLAEPPPGAFLDCLHFDPPFLTGLGVLLGDEGHHHVRVGLEQALAYVEVLQERSGLFAHFVLEGVEGRFGHGWGRGQGWALLGLLDVLENLSGHRAEDAAFVNEACDEIRCAAVSLVQAMLACQREDGHWNAVVDDPFSGVEGSTAAFMAEGFRRAVQLGVGSADQVGPAQERAREAVRCSLDERGTLRDVSAAVMACTVESHYSNVPRGFRVPWGQGPALLALTVHHE